MLSTLSRSGFSHTAALGRRWTTAAFSSSTARCHDRFEDKVAVVTGAGRDIGAACALRLAEEGAAVVLHYHSSAEGADAVAGTIVDAGGRAEVVKADLTQAGGATAIVDAAGRLGDSIHAVVANSGGLVERRPLSDLTVDFVNHVLSLNFVSLVTLMQACAPRMTEGGAVVTLSSQAARDGGGPGASIYAASKGAVLTYTRSLAKELSAQGVRVNTVTPGMINTGFHDTFTAAEVRKNVAAATLVKREGSSEEVAAVVAFLLSEEASYLTGNAIDINGGLAFSA